MLGDKHWNNGASAAEREALMEAIRLVCATVGVVSLCERRQQQQQQHFLALEAGTGNEGLSDYIEATSFFDLGVVLIEDVKGVDKVTLSRIGDEVEALPSRCERQVHLLRSLGVGSTILALVSASEVTMFIVLLRSTQRKELVGTLDDYLWMRSALGIVVATPQDMAFDHAGPSNFGGIILPHESSDFLDQQVRPFVSSIHKCRFVKKNWLAEAYRAIPSKEVRSLLERHLPEVLQCPGLGDAVFRVKTNSFSSLGHSFLFLDWSGILAVLPGIVHASVGASSTSCLVVAPLSRVAQLTNLIRGFVSYLGIRGVLVGCVNQGVPQDKVHIAVGTPDKIAAVDTKQVVLVQADELLATGFAQQVEALLSIPAVQVGLHAVVRSPAVEEAVSRLTGNTFCAKGGASLDLVDLYVSEVPECNGGKVNMVLNLWRVLGKTVHKMQLAVYCNSPESVRKLGKELDRLGVPVCQRHSEMGLEALKKTEMEFDTFKNELVVTDLYAPGSPMDVVNYELPGTPEKFVARVGRHRGRHRAKIVINLVASDQERQLLAAVAEQYQVCISSLPDKLPRVYIRSLDRRRGL